MKEPLREVDANLLLALHALLEECNLTHAGERMTMSQSAMSATLTPLREILSSVMGPSTAGPVPGSRRSGAARIY